MEWVKIQKFGRYSLWKNIIKGYRECFWPENDPNELDIQQEQKTAKLSEAQKKAKKTRRKEPAWSKRRGV